jgi:hypothetical protein
VILRFKRTRLTVLPDDPLRFASVHTQDGQPQSICLVKCERTAAFRLVGFQYEVSLNATGDP